MKTSSCRSLPDHRLGALGALTLAAAMMPGCQKALFPQDTPRTQFELQDRMRGRFVPLEEPDVFGRPQPALRARLLAE